MILQKTVEEVHSKSAEQTTIVRKTQDIYTIEVYVVTDMINFKA